MDYADFCTAGLVSQIDNYVRRAEKHVKFAKTAQRNDRSVQDIWFDPEDGSVVVRSLSSTGNQTDPSGIKLANARETPVQDHWCGLALSGSRDYFQKAKEQASTMMGLVAIASRQKSR